MNLKPVALETGVANIYAAPAAQLVGAPRAWHIDERPVRAWARHPDFEDLILLTTSHPEMLSHLPDGYVEVD